MIYNLGGIFGNCRLHDRHKNEKSLRSATATISCQLLANESPYKSEYMSLRKLYSMPGHLLRRCQQISVAIFLDECADTDFKPVDFAVLSALDAMGGIDQVTLSGLIAIDRSSIGRIVDKLESQGIIGRQSDLKDRRIKRLRLTRKGSAVIRDIQPAVDRVQDRILEPLTRKEQRQFMRCLEKLTLGNNDVSRAPIREVQSRIKELPSLRKS